MSALEAIESSNALAGFTKDIKSQPLEPGRVYFMATTDRRLVKIGKTRGLEVRHAKIQGQSPERLILLAEIEGYTAVERWFHKQFAAYRTHGEWFKFEGPVRMLVQALMNNSAHPCITERELDKGVKYSPLLPKLSVAATPSKQELLEVGEELGEAMAKVLPTLSDIEAEKCRRSLAYFVRKAWDTISPGITLHWNWHLEEICKHVQGILEEWIQRQIDPTYKMKLQNLIINCPPRSLKSTIVSICAPAWMWLRWPTWKVVFVSANPRVALRDARGCHSLMESPWYLELKQVLAERYKPESPERKKFDWELDATHDADLNFSNTSGGYRIAMGFTAVAVGLGGDAIFVDDPNDPKKVVSETERNTINDTWDLTLCNRVNDFTSSIRVMIMQRVHEDDLTGHWLATMSQAKLCHLPIPLEYDVELRVKTPFNYHDPRTIPGSCLFPLRYPPDVVEEERARLGPFGFPAQMNQNPSPLTGGLFDRGWWNFCHLETRDGLDPVHGAQLDTSSPIRRPKGCDLKRRSMAIPFLDVLVISVDCTFGSLTETASNVGLVGIGVKGADRFVLEDRTKARSFIDTVADIRQMAKDFPSANTILIEKKANGAAVIEVLKHELSGIIEIEANENWLVRAHAMVPSVHAGNWYLLEGAPWLTPFVSEFARCSPNSGAKDDRIDSCSQLAKYFEMGGYRLCDW